MFATMIQTENGKIFEIWEDLTKAQERANSASCAGYEVTVFDYDVESKQYIEFYSI